MTLADEIRAETKRIIARHYGGVPDAISAIRVATVEKIDAFVEHASERLASCTCAQEPAYSLPIRRFNRPLDAALDLAHQKRRAAVDATLSWKPYGREVL